MWFIMYGYLVSIKVDLRINKKIHLLYRWIFLIQQKEHLAKEMKKMFSLSLFLYLLLFPGSLSAQDYYRFTADFVIKEKLDDEASQLITGKVYFDKYVKKLVYEVQFPEPSVIVMQDTLLYKLRDGVVEEIKSIPPLAENSVFYQLLERKTKNFGLNDPGSGYVLSNVEKVDDQVISTYVPVEELKTIFGTVLISIKKGQLYGVVIKSKEGEILSKQFFRKYVNVLGLEVPTEMIIFNFLPSGQTHKKITTFKNVRINENENDFMYNYPVGGK